jgi:hypothetical protein
LAERPRGYLSAPIGRPARSAVCAPAISRPVQPPPQTLSPMEAQNSDKSGIRPTDRPTRPYHLAPPPAVPPAIRAAICRLVRHLASLYAVRLAVSPRPRNHPGPAICRLLSRLAPSAVLATIRTGHLPPGLPSGPAISASAQPSRPPFVVRSAIWPTICRLFSSLAPPSAVRFTFVLLK